MAKSFVLYNVLEVEGELVDCIYYVNGMCRAQPFTVVEGRGTRGGFYKPTEEEQKKYCKNGGDVGIPDDFIHCIRYRAYLDYLRAKGLEE